LLQRLRRDAEDFGELVGGEERVSIHAINSGRMRDCCVLSIVP
jgi:hypothetical protein